MTRAGLGYATARVAAVLGAALCAAAGLPAHAAGDFRLRVDAAGLADYFPGMLGNGMLATLTARRGTRATQTYMVGLMDRTPGDMARPALLPGWNGIDYDPQPAAGELDWMDRSALNATRFRDYHQTLDLHDAVLTTRYRYIAGTRVTTITVVSFLSQRETHLGVIRLSITPNFSGRVALDFPLTLWPPHSPRFALGRLTGAQVNQALAAHGLTLTPRAPATPDRAALWYPGTVAVSRTGLSAAAHTLWLAGRAANSLPIAMAAAVALPRHALLRSVTGRRGPGRLALRVTLHVRRGHTYTFTKFASLSRAGWGGGSAADLARVRAARARGFAALLKQQRAAWRTLWQADIRIEGDRKAQQVAHSALYYLLANTSPDTGWAVGPCGLTLCYAGHVFWDSDTWVYQALLLLHPRRARSLLTFRERTLQAARVRARALGYLGAMYPWESDPYNGSDQTPASARALSLSEIHVNAEIAIAQWQYYLTTLDRHWLRTRGWPVIRAVARFFASRAVYDAKTGRYDILHVTSVSESHGDIPNDTYTNLVAVRALRIAVAAARALGVAPGPHWQRMAARMDIPLAPGGGHHLPYQGSFAAAAGPAFWGGPLPLLFLPALDLRLPLALWRGDYAVAVRPAPLAHFANVSMGILPCVAAADMVGRAAAAGRCLDLYLSGGTLKPPFNVRTETASNNVGPFLTGSGAYLQSLIFALTGLRIRHSGLVDAYTAVLPRGWRSLTLRGVQFRGQRLEITVVRGAHGRVQLKRRVL
ncbi:MAG: glycoside hydrolase family 65 protein [Pseudomonadota bacterium]|nr:glycoside hydrolase family 65 protein [Pseudomonadota bacterium]